MEWDLDSEGQISPKPTVSIPLNDDTLIFIDKIKDHEWYYIRIENMNGRIILTPEMDGIEGIVRILEPLFDDLLSRGVKFDRTA